MSDPLLLRIKRKLWKTALGERSWITKNESFRVRESHGLIQRPNYVYGMLRAADTAKYYGKKSVTVLEFGVASGAGLLNMIESADLITKETGVRFRIVGFDTGCGLPGVFGYKDHPELWNPGDFAMQDRAFLLKRIGGRAEVVWGDIAETIGPFTEKLDPSSPLGFASIDVDLYTATKSALYCLSGPADNYLPAISLYFDDVSFFSANEWCGELLAIEELNKEHELRKISRDHSLPGRRAIPADSWYKSMFVAHVLDHPARQVSRDRKELTIERHHEFIQAANL